MNENLENRIAELRRERKVRQEDLAEIVGVTRQTIISLEKKNYKPSVALALKLSEYFGLCVNEIFYFSRH